MHYYAQVQGSRQGDYYTVFPQHYCSCQAFLYSVVGHGHPVVRPMPPLALLLEPGGRLRLAQVPLDILHAMQCKHQLAARIAEVLQRCHIQTIPDEVLAELLLSI